MLVPPFLGKAAAGRPFTREPVQSERWNRQQPGAVQEWKGRVARLAGQEVLRPYESRLTVYHPPSL
jgi:hypothetical protein